jgi:hypothetical protein
VKETLLAKIARRSVDKLVRVACVLALLGLAVMLYPLVFPSALGVVLSMGIGHAFGIAAGALYFLAVIIDLIRRER